METPHPIATELASLPNAGASKTVVFTIGTLMTDAALYGRMVSSFLEKGFSSGDCEFIYIDNRVHNTHDAYRGLNKLLRAARGKYVILCHQDILLHADDRSVLEQRLSELERIDPRWAVAGNAGGREPGYLSIRISDPHGENQRTGSLPDRVLALDENFLLVKAETGVAFSSDLSGFHLYGTDICLHADIRGHSAYTIDFHLRHLSPGKYDQGFRDAEAAFETKWKRALRRRRIQTTCTILHLKGNLE